MNLSIVTEEQVSEARERLKKVREFFLDDKECGSRISALSITTRQMVQAAQLSSQFVNTDILDKALSMSLNYLLIEIHKRQTANKMRDRYQIELISLLIAKASHTGLNLSDFDAKELDTLTSSELKEALTWLENIDKPGVTNDIVPEFLQKYQ